MRKSTIYLVRHSITEGNKKGLFYGCMDLPLIQEGIRKVESIAAENRYPHPGYARIYTSGLTRTEMTLEAMYGMMLPHEVIEDLQEYRFGEWEGLTYDEIMLKDGVEDFMKGEDLNFAPPGGESYNEFHKRVEAGWDTVVKNHRVLELSHRHSGIDATSILVSHGGVINHIMNLLFGDGDEEGVSYRLMPDTANGYAIHMMNGEPVSYSEI